MQSHPITQTAMLGVSPSHYCGICGRALSNPASVARGIGPICGGRGHHEPAADDNGDCFDLPFDPETGDIVCRMDDRGPGRSGRHFNIRQRHVHHSPSGMAWGYSGSGPADLALNILALFVGPAPAEIPYPDGDDYDSADLRSGHCDGWLANEETRVRLWDGSFVHRDAWDHYQDFKRDFVAALPDEGGVIPGATIRAWLRERGVEPIR